MSVVVVAADDGRRRASVPCDAELVCQAVGCVVDADARAEESGGRSLDSRKRHSGRTCDGERGEIDAKLRKPTTICFINNLGLHLYIFYIEYFLTCSLIRLPTD